MDATTPVATLTICANWSRPAKPTLEALNTAAHAAREAGLAAVPAHIVDPLISRFVRTIHVGLLLRLRDCQQQVLLFARDLTVRFTNNQAERDLHMIKAQRVRGYISIARKTGLHIITALRDAIAGNPWLPTTVEMA